jgi:hypothetical protein
MLKIIKKTNKPKKLTPFRDLTLDYMLEYAYDKMKVKKKDRIYSEDIDKENKQEIITELCEKLHIDWFIFEVLKDEKLRKDEWLFEFLFNEMYYESAYYTESLHKYFETAYDRMIKVVNRRKRMGEIDKYCDWKINIIRIQD